MKRAIQLYLFAVPMAVLTAKDLWPAFWPGPWLIVLAGMAHGALVSLYGLLEHEAGEARRAGVEAALGWRDAGIEELELR